LEEPFTILQNVRANANTHQKGSVLSEYAKLHRDCNALRDSIGYANSEVVKIVQIAEEQRRMGDENRAKLAAQHAELFKLKKDLDEINEIQKSLTKEFAKVEQEATRMRSCIRWAKNISPLLEPTVDNIPLLLLHRHQAIQISVTSPGNADLKVLRELDCTAEELVQYSDIEVRLRKSGFSAPELKRMGFSTQQLKEAGFLVSDVVKADPSLSTAELKCLGFTAAELLDCEVCVFAVDDLVNGAYCVTELRQAGFTAAELGAAGCSEAALKDGGFSAMQLKDGGFSAMQLKEVGFTLDDLKTCGFSLGQLLSAEFDVVALKSAGFSATQLNAEGLTLIALLTAGFTEAELQLAGFGTVLIRTAQVAMSGSAAAADLLRKGFDAAQLRAAGFSLPGDPLHVSSNGHVSPHL